MLLYIYYMIGRQNDSLPPCQRQFTSRPRAVIFSPLFLLVKKVQAFHAIRFIVYLFV